MLALPPCAAVHSANARLAIPDVPARRSGAKITVCSKIAHPGGDSPPSYQLDFQFAVFDLQSRTGLPAPLGVAKKTKPELLNDSAFLPAAGPAPVYLSICGPLIRPPMSCATAIEETVLHAFAAGTLSKMTVPVGIEVGSVATEAFGVTAI